MHKTNACTSRSLSRVTHRRTCWCLQEHIPRTLPLGTVLRTLIVVTSTTRIPCFSLVSTFCSSLCARVKHLDRNTGPSPARNQHVVNLELLVEDHSRFSTTTTLSSPFATNPRPGIRHNIRHNTPDKSRSGQCTTAENTCSAGAVDSSGFWPEVPVHVDDSLLCAK